MGSTSSPNAHSMYRLDGPSCFSSYQLIQPSAFSDGCSKLLCSVIMNRHCASVCSISCCVFHVPVTADMQTSSARFSGSSRSQSHTSVIKAIPRFVSAIVFSFSLSRRFLKKSNNPIQPSASSVDSRITRRPSRITLSFVPSTQPSASLVSLGRVIRPPTVILTTSSRDITYTGNKG